ncbi:MAG: hypothetical protein IJ583_02255, partial [Firmicutes bacterium]|nr:hypothetical protein [Bacillota bacterium]
MIDYTVSGYIISDNKFNKLQDCKNCISCSKLKSNYKDYSDIGIIVATWDLYFNEIIANLNEIGFPIMNTYFLPGWNKRTISHKMTPRSKERIGIEVNLADHCNLNCQMCDHFAPLAKPTFLDIKAFRKDMERLAYRTDNHIG